MRRRSIAFYEEHFNPYLNFHRPCGVPELVVNAKGKVQESVPVVCDAMGDPAAVARLGGPPQSGRDDSGSGAGVAGPERQRRGGEHAKSQRAPVCRFPQKAERMTGQRHASGWPKAKTDEIQNRRAENPKTKTKDKNQNLL